MCPVCIATAALIAGKVTSASGAAAITIRKLGGNNAAQNPIQLNLNRPEEERSKTNRPELESPEPESKER